MMRGYKYIKNSSHLIYRSIILMNPILLMSNPMMFLVWVAAIIATSLSLQELIMAREDLYLFSQMTFWLWMTIFFSCASQAYANQKLIDSKILSKRKMGHMAENVSGQGDSMDNLLESEKDSWVRDLFGITPNETESKTQNHRLVRRVLDKNDLSKYELVDFSEIRAGNYIYLKSGDEVMFDGEVVAGKCYVFESELTGEIGDALKTPGGDNNLIAGSDLYGENDYLIMKVRFSKEKSFFAKLSNKLQGITRSSMPSELALQRIILGLSILFISVIFTVAVIAEYSGVHIPLIYLLDLIVILLPTTIAGLQGGIIIFAKAGLAKKDIIVQDHVALDNAVDVDIALFDKTGTITIGHRQIADFVLLNDEFQNEYMEYMYLSSIEDYTVEGLSIASYANKHLQKENLLYISDIKHLEEIRQNILHQREIRLNSSMLDKTSRNKQRHGGLEDDVILDVKDALVNKSNKYLFHQFTSNNRLSGCDLGTLKIRKGSVLEITKYLGITSDELSNEIKNLVDKIASAHGTALLLAVGKDIIGVIHLRDRFRKGVVKQLDRLKKSGISVGILTGDNELTAAYMAEKLEMDMYYADCTAEKKLSIIKHLQEQGHNVAMCGDGINDALALAQADIGIAFSTKGKVHSILSGNIISNSRKLCVLHDLKKMCRRMTAKRGALTVFSLASDIAKYFVIVPALFTTAFPELAVLNFMHFGSLESVVLSSVMFNALIIFVLTPLVFNDTGWIKSKKHLWKNAILFAIGGIAAPFIGIKLLDLTILALGVV